MQTSNTTHKLVTVLNKNLAPGVALNAIAHMALGLAARAAAEDQRAIDDMRFQNFVDKDGGDHPYISALSLIVLRGTSNEIRKLRSELQSAGVSYVDFTNQMTGETYVEQLQRSRETPESELEYYGVCAFGPKSQLDPLTRKLSLWR